jgi:hypothetical protein
MIFQERFGSGMSLLQRIAALHMLYHKYRSQIMWFGQLVAHSPEIMYTLPIEKIKYSQEMVMFEPMCTVLDSCLITIGSSSTSS